MVYHAQVITDFGEIRPLTNTRDAKVRHIEALPALFSRFGPGAPTNLWPGKVVRYASMAYVEVIRSCKRPG